MHGTFRIHAPPGTGRVAPTPGRELGRRGSAAVVLLSGCAVLGVSWSPVADRLAPYEGPIPPAVPSLPLVEHVTTVDLVESAARATASAQPLSPDLAEPTEGLARFVPEIRIDLPPPERVETLAPVTPSWAASDGPSAPDVYAVIAAQPPAPHDAGAAPEPRATAPRAVDIEQISISAEVSAHVAQLDEHGSAPDLPAVVEKAHVARLSVSRLVEQELAALQANAPSEVVVRIGNAAVGRVAIRIGETNAIDVQLSGLLDVMADRFGPEDFARLRESAAAGAYVPMDQLRAAGIALRYDAVYDELLVSA